MISGAHGPLIFPFKQVDPEVLTINRNQLIQHNSKIAIFAVSDKPSNGQGQFSNCQDHHFCAQHCQRLKCQDQQPSNGQGHCGNSNYPYGNGQNQPSTSQGQHSNGQTQPRNGQIQPSSGQDQPSNRQGQPSNSQGQPRNGQGQPSKKQGQPSNGQSPPSNGQSQPSNGQSQPRNGQGQSMTGQGQPSNNQGQPGNGQGPPSKGQTQPFSCQGHFCNNQGQPSNGQSQPSNGQGQPSKGQNQHFSCQHQPLTGQVHFCNYQGQPPNGQGHFSNNQGQPSNGQNQAYSGQGQQTPSLQIQHVVQYGQDQDSADDNNEPSYETSWVPGTMESIIEQEIKVNLPQNIEPCRGEPEVNQPYREMPEANVNSKGMPEVNVPVRGTSEVNAPYWGKPEVNAPYWGKPEGNVPSKKMPEDNVSSREMPEVKAPYKGKLDVNVPCRGKPEDNVSWKGMPEVNVPYKGMTGIINIPSSEAPAVNMPCGGTPEVGMPHMEPPEGKPCKRPSQVNISKLDVNEYLQWQWEKLVQTLDEMDKDYPDGSSMSMCECAHESSPLTISEEALRLHLAAKQLQCPEWADRFILLIGRRLLTISKGARFLALDPMLVCSILCSDYLDVPNERNVFRAAHRWIDHDPSGRSQYAQHIMGCARYGLMPKEDLIKCIVCRRRLKECVMNMPPFQRSLTNGLVWSCMTDLDVGGNFPEFEPMPRIHAQEAHKDQNGGAATGGIDFSADQMSEPDLKQPNGGPGQRPNWGDGQKTNRGAGQKPTLGAGQKPTGGVGQKPNGGAGQKPNEGAGQKPKADQGKGTRKMSNLTTEMTTECAKDCRGRKPRA